MGKKKQIASRINVNDWIKNILNFDIDFDYFFIKAKEDYKEETKGNYPKYYEGETLKEEKDILFGNISKIFQKRGYLRREEFISIGLWKTPRQKSNFEDKDNSDETVRRITQEVIKSEENKMKILVKGIKDDSGKEIKLKGVDVAVASAILAIIYPKQYCVVDYRAKQALAWLKKCGESEPYDNCILKSYNDYLFISEFVRNTTHIDIYDKYLEIINGVAMKQDPKLNPRQIELALWKFDKDKDREFWLI
jgi:hypothetical protein